MPPSSSRLVQKPPPAGTKVNQVTLGNLRFTPWYDALYPEELVDKNTDSLYVCCWCFRYTCDRDAYAGHTSFCEYRSAPPGTQIYCYGGYSVWEVDGADHKLFGQNLSLFAKLFLDQKTVCFDVTGFLFYILVYVDPSGPGTYYILGYFSKEKMSWDANNLACILIFPPYQRKSLGKFLIGVSYRLSIWEWEHGIGTIGGPERPLSEMGEKSYIRFWEERVARYFLGDFLHNGTDEKERLPKSKAKRKRKTMSRREMTLEEVGQATGMLVEDVITAIKSMGIATEERPKKKQKKKSTSDDEVEDDCNAVIKKSSVLEWARARDIDLEDPVREEGFLGKWAQRRQREQSQPEDD